MTNAELRDRLRVHMIPNVNSKLALKLSKEPNAENELELHANLNGILVLCDSLLYAIDQPQLQSGHTYTVDEEMFDSEESALWITKVYIEESVPRPEAKATLGWDTIGCMAVLVVMVVIFITGLVTTFSWLTNFY